MATSERVVNGGFETGDATGWTLGGGGYVTAGGGHAGTPHSGTYFLQLWGSGTGSQVIDLTQVPQITFWYTTDSNATITFKIDSVTKLTTGTSVSWTKFTYDTSAYSGDHTILFINNSGDHCGIDDVTAFGTDPTPPIDPTVGGPVSVGFGSANMLMG